MRSYKYIEARFIKTAQLMYNFITFVVLVHLLGCKNKSKSFKTLNLAFNETNFIFLPYSRTFTI